MEGLSETVFLVKTRLRPTGAPPPPKGSGCPVMLASHSMVGKGPPVSRLVAPWFGASWEDTGLCPPGPGGGSPCITPTPVFTRPGGNIKYP